MECSAINETSIPHTLPLKLKEHHRRATFGDRGQGEWGKTVSSGHDRTIALMNSHVWLPAKVYAKSSHSAFQQGEGRNKPPPLAKVSMVLTFI